MNINMNLEETGFIVQSYDLENNIITVTPYVTSFKNPVSSYPSYNVTISNLDMSLDINSQIAVLVSSIVKSTLAAESNSFSNITSSLDALLNVPITMNYQTAFSQVSSVGIINIDSFTSNVDLSSQDIYSSLGQTDYVDVSGVPIDGVTFV
jgi:hypothetical protein